MPSFRITIKPSKRAGARFVSDVRRTLLRTLETEKKNGLTQSEIARRLEVHRSVISREIRGQADITQGRIGELAWAMGYKPVFKLERIQQTVGANIPAPSASQEEHIARNKANLAGNITIYKAA